MALANQVAIIGSGVIRFGENFHQSYTDMVYEAARWPSPTLEWSAHGCRQAGWAATSPCSTGSRATPGRSSPTR